MSTNLVAFTGLAGAGKTAAALHLVERHGFVRTRFADPLKAMLRAIGLGADEIDGSLKERPSALLCGRTPRHAMQTLGTEWGRQCVAQNLWTTLWSARAGDCLDLGGRVVVDDCRFPDEADVVRRMGGIVVRLSGRGGIAGSHASEAQAFDADVELGNAGSLDELHAWLDQIIGPARLD